MHPKPVCPAAKAVSPKGNADFNTLRWGLQVRIWGNFRAVSMALIGFAPCPRVFSAVSLRNGKIDNPFRMTATSASTLVCFAVREEARPFQQIVSGGNVRVLVTGMGKRNAEASLRKSIVAAQPGRVISCGFAGGLDPELKLGAILFTVDDMGEFEKALRSAGARPGKFHCSDRVAATAAEKHALRERTGADAVEMESGVMGVVCRESGIPFATVRVILDTAGEDLPLDFNKLMTRRDTLSYPKLAGALVASPGKIAVLMRFQKKTQEAAEALARVLANSLRD